MRVLKTNRAAILLLMSLGIIAGLYFAPIVMFSVGINASNIPNALLCVWAHAHPSEKVSDTACIVLFAKTKNETTYKTIIRRAPLQNVYENVNADVLKELSYFSLQKMKRDVPGNFANYLDKIMYCEGKTNQLNTGRLCVPPTPEWADYSAHDNFGVRIGIKICDGVMYYMRWCFASQEQSNVDLSMNNNASGAAKTADGFWIGETEITNRIWSAVMKDGMVSNGDNKSLDFPVAQVSYDDCIMFVEKLNSTKKNVTFTMPTEKQWELACTGNNDLPFVLCNLGSDDAVREEIINIAASIDTINLIPATYKGHGVDGCMHGLLLLTCTRIHNNLGWFHANSNMSPERVRQKIPNHIGVYDMHGNVMEWCSDFVNRKDQDDLWESADGGQVAKGGSYMHLFVDSFKNKRFKLSSRRVGAPFIGFRIIAEQERREIRTGRRTGTNPARSKRRH